MSAPVASGLVSGSIATLAILVAVAIVALCARGGEPAGRLRRGLIASVLLSTWLGAGWILAERGVLAHLELRPPPIMFFILISVVGAIVLGRSALGRRIALEAPLWALVGMQAFRLPLELAMHRAVREGVMPEQMSFTGYNFDIVSGAGALLVAVLLANGWAPGWVVWLWDVIGALLLLVIVVIAVLSLPMFHAFGTTPERLNTWVAFAPYIWLPSVLVPSALLGHILVTHRLRLAPAAAT
ncbi:MAG: hypothetical protein ABI609_07075 [Acidobacteriota bacterium]